VTSIACAGLSVTIDGHRLLDGVDIEVPSGQWLNVVGPNGAGKTTLLRALAGLADFDGAVTVDDRDSRQFGRRAWARCVGLVPQTPVVPAGMTVAQYVLLGRTPHLGPLRAEGPADIEAARAALERLDLLPFAPRKVETLSGGERQRVIVARLLAQDAPVVLLDEPTTALDVGHQQQVLDLVEELRHHHALTVVATMHDLTIAGQYGDRLALMAEGRIVASGAADEVLTEDVLSTYYGARVRVLPSDDGPIVVPVRQERA
jgi:iron complex transport system ATP-binding protein